MQPGMYEYLCLILRVSVVEGLGTQKRRSKQDQQLRRPTACTLLG